MNNNQNIGDLICSICGNKLLNQNIGYCPKCGNKIDKRIIDTADLEIQYNVKTPKTKNTSGIILLVLSIVNLVTIVPFVVYFSVIWLLFGTFSNDEFLYYGLLLFCCGYFGASIVSIIAYIINLIKKGRILKKCFLAIFISFCLSVIAPIILVNSNYSPSKAEMEKNALIENQVIFQNDDLIIKQQKIHYDKSDVKVYFNLETKEIDNYSLPSYLTVQVNQCLMSATLSKSEDSRYDNLYYISISYNELKTYNIKGISTINFDIYNKKENNNINLNIKTNSKNTDIHKTTGLENYELIYSNEYFKLYFDPNYSSGSGNLYIQSLVSHNYSLSFSKLDFDTQGYINYINDVQLYDYSITNSKLYFYPCNENMHYVKFDYVIKNEQHEVIAQEHIELNFSVAKISTKYCRK